MSLNMILGFRAHTAESWMPEVLKTQASEGKGTEEVAEFIHRHRSFLETTGMLERNRKLRLERRIREIIEDQLHIDFWSTERSRELHQRLELLLQRQSNPYEVAAGLLDDFRTSGGQQ
jgi:LAO/AO transport system kinase